MAKGRPTMFSADVFVREVQAASVAANPITAVQEVVATTIVDGPSIDSVFGTELKGDNDTLFSSEALTVQRIAWVPGLPNVPHEHRMWAVVGVYAGEELNRIYERSPDGLTKLRTRAVPERDVFVLDADAIHSVENPGDEWTAALHVYGGDIVNIERNAWGPDGREVPFAEVDSTRRAMFAPMRALSEEYGKPMDSKARYLAITALMAASEQERRYPTPAEARRIVATAWKLEP
jgi:predicted metal-dependent enzyme (double-stranded beta helix superfamily)